MLAAQVSARAAEDGGRVLLLVSHRADGSGSWEAHKMGASPAAGAVRRPRQRMRCILPASLARIMDLAVRGSARCQGVGFAVGLLASASNLDFRIQKDSVSCSTMYFTLSLFCKHACFNLRVDAPSMSAAFCSLPHFCLIKECDSGPGRSAMKCMLVLKGVSKL